jgi:hypothetical protein
MEALGVMVEVIFYLVVDDLLESRPGLLHLPLRRVHGIGGVACTLFLHRGLRCHRLYQLGGARPGQY